MDAWNERKWLWDQSRRTMDLVTVSILHTKTDLDKSVSDEVETRTLLEHQEKGSVDISARLSALETRQHQFLQDIPDPVGPAARQPLSSVASSAHQP